MRGHREKKKIEKLNLIPILDSVFIIIFFLLMSAKFINLRVIGSDLPVVSETPPPKEKKIPLALTLVVKGKTIQVKTGLEGKIIKTINLDKESYDRDELYKSLLTLKKGHPEEKDVILEVDKRIKYSLIVNLMDDVRSLKKEDIFEAEVKGKKISIDKLFNNIVFSNIAS